jgi:hypothetical protein
LCEHAAFTLLSLLLGGNTLSRFHKLISYFFRFLTLRIKIIGIGF